MAVTKVFKSGNSMAVRLPKGFAFSSERVEIQKKGDMVIIREIPQNLSRAFELLSSFPSDFYAEPRVDLPPQVRESF